MRLIDLDKLLLQVKMRRYTKASLSLLYNQEVVDAIPIKWIEKQIEKALSADSVDMFYVGSLKHLIEAWRKENETN